MLPTQVSARTTPQHTTQHIPAITHHTLNVVRLAYTIGKVNRQVMQILIDSGASCSAISKRHVKIDQVLPEQCTKLVNTDGRVFQPLGKSPMTVSLGEFSANHTFVVVKQLSVPVILGSDFISQYGLILDIQGGSVYQSGSPDFRLKLDTYTANICDPLVMDNELPQAIPCRSTDPCQLDLPYNVHPALTQIVTR